MVNYPLDSSTDYFPGSDLTFDWAEVSEIFESSELIPLDSEGRRYTFTINNPNGDYADFQSLAFDYKQNSGDVTIEFAWVTGLVDNPV
jgi:hypothetical protein